MTSGLRRHLAFIGLAGLIGSCTIPAPSTSMASAKLPDPPPPGPCVAEYSALLDLADLARRYGSSAGIFLHPIGDVVDQLDACLAASDEADEDRPVKLEIGFGGPAKAPLRRQTL